ncbi:MAG TPA: lipid-binding SYLF domain-containing protein [Candidatus Polarisedimenticolia bacterium]|jgi:lipid-binding SYLF domain-containing protein
MRTLTTSILIAALVVSPAIAHEKRSVKRLHDAEQVLRMSVTAPDKGIPKDALERAECVGVFPGVKKAAFVVGGEFGRGVFTCRQQDGTMGAPAFFTMGGPSVGWQLGGQEADLVLLVMNETGVKHLLQDHVKLGGEISAVAGPVGRTVEAGTDAQLHAQILSWSRSRGLFVGASLEGTVINLDKKTTEAFYGKPVTARQILVDHATEVPRAARSFVQATTECSRRS